MWLVKWSVKLSVTKLVENFFIKETLNRTHDLEEPIFTLLGAIRVIKGWASIGTSCIAICSGPIKVVSMDVWPSTQLHIFEAALDLCRTLSISDSDVVQGNVTHPTYATTSFKDNLQKQEWRQQLSQVTNTSFTWYRRLGHCSTLLALLGAQWKETNCWPVCKTPLHPVWRFLMLLHSEAP